MAIDTLILGPFEFTDFAVPTNMPYGGKQQTVVHKMPGGARTIDTMGPDDTDYSWSGILWGNNASSSMALLNALRRAGDELGFSWGAESRTCVIGDCTFEVEKWTCIHYKITIIFSDTGDSIGLIPALGTVVLADLASALSLIS